MKPLRKSRRTMAGAWLLGSAKPCAYDLPFQVSALSREGAIQLSLSAAARFGGCWLRTQASASCIERTLSQAELLEPAVHVARPDGRGRGGGGGGGLLGLGIQLRVRGDRDHGACWSLNLA